MHTYTFNTVNRSIQTIYRQDVDLLFRFLSLPRQSVIIFWCSIVGAVQFTHGFQFKSFYQQSSTQPFPLHRLKDITWHLTEHCNVIFPGA